jgi:GT2 family glycosyltransferase
MITQLPFTSILIPFRNHTSLLNQCLAGLANALGSDTKRVEVLLLDNGSDEAHLNAVSIPQHLSCRVLSMPIPFNFQTINNAGAHSAEGDFLLFLNNDLVFTEESRNFLRPLIQFASASDVGAVGPRLMYADGTFQHCGVVVGMSHYADHLYRGWNREQAAHFPFTSPHQTRYVSAVTGACMLVERCKFQSVHGFDERFTVCGGDVDLCLRLHSAGYKTIYVGEVGIIHLESKSRDPRDIPSTDFTESARSYGAFLALHQGRDPYYPPPLPLVHTVESQFLRSWRGDRVGAEPHQSTTSQLTNQIPQFGLWDKLKAALPVAAKKLFKVLSKLIAKPSASGRVATARSVQQMGLPHMSPIRFHREFPLKPTPRLTILLPHLEERALYGGIATAALLGLKFKVANPDICLRFVLTDGEGSKQAVEDALEAYFGDELYSIDYEVRVAYDRANPAISINIHEKDVFMATAWWTCYSASMMSSGKPFVYLIQDYEPCFYPWGEEYAGAAATYNLNFVPIYNSSQLAEYFNTLNIVTNKSAAIGATFEPAINPNLFGARDKRIPHQSGKRLLLFYGRPTVARNLFSTGCQAVAQAILLGHYAPSEWLFFSAGEPHTSVDLGHGAILQSLGKLSLPEYSRLLESVDVGLSLMLSPHPSYPPLEIASRGAICVTNNYATKDLGLLHSNIISCQPSVAEVTGALIEAEKKALLLSDAPPTHNSLSYCWDNSFDTSIAFLASYLRS